MRLDQGDIVLLRFRFAGGQGSKLRPALVVQRSDLNATLIDTVLAMVTTQFARPLPPMHVLLDPSIHEGATSGLHGVSVVRCEKLYTVEKHVITG
jgi:mRNA-degrading endonuclease toxin of MazEF toxin-antitoxin module